MPSNTRTIKRRIKSVSHIRQITRAMQLVATSKMKRANKRSEDANAYVYGALDILEQLTKSLSIKGHPFWKEHKSKRVCVILMTTNRGFCGGMNVSLFNLLLAFLKEKERESKEVDFITIGKKGQHFVRKIGQTIVADFSSIEEYFTPSSLSPLVHLAITKYLNKTYQDVYLCFTQFINTLSQKPRIRQILPITEDSFKEIAKFDPKIQQYLFPSYTKPSFGVQYHFEPSAEKVFEMLFPYLIEIEIYKALLETHASEHSARMVAMKNATDKAQEVMDDLHLVYNQARQANITKEIAEISTGAAATR